MTMSPGLVSIGMSVRNNEKTLAHSIRSVLGQTYTDWELILIDDGSSDQTVAIARRFADGDARIRLYVDGARHGLPDRLNQSIDLSRGAYFARMDGDDVAYPRRLERQVGYLQANPEVDLVGAWAIIFGNGGKAFGKRTGAEHHDAICARPHAGFPLIHPTYLGRIDYFRRHRYRASAIRCEDQDMLLRSLDRRPRGLARGLAKCQDQDLLIRSYHSARFANVPEILLGYREERIDLKKILTSRYYMVQCFWHELRVQGHQFLALRAVVEQGLKAMLDVFAVKTGLNYRIMRHRARPASRSELRQWEEVWAGLENTQWSSGGMSPFAPRTGASFSGRTATRGSDMSRS
jgi:glycosyltransferase involved in cell wall biosynthesis